MEGQGRPPAKRGEMPQFSVQHYRGVYAGHENGGIPQYSSLDGIEGNGIPALHSSLLGQLPQDSDGLRRHLVDLQTESARLREARFP